MPLTMNKESMQQELHKLSGEESYLATLWATMQTSTPKLFTYYTITDKRPKIGARNIYCYIGVTETSFNIVTLNPLDVTRATGYFHIPLSDLVQVTITNGLLKGSALLDFKNEKLKLTWVHQATGTDMKDQRKHALRLSEFFKTEQ